MMIHRIALYIHGNASNITPQDALRFAAKIYERLDFSPIFEQVDEIIREIAPGLGCNDSPPWATSHSKSEDAYEVVVFFDELHNREEQ